jgi:hypothetical protein
MKELVAAEVAEQEFIRFVDVMDIDPEALDDEDHKNFEQQKGLVISAIVSGRLVITDNGEPVFTPSRTNDATPITFYEPTGASLMAMDRKKKTEDIGKLYAAMGDITKTSAGTFSKMRMSDLKVCIALTNLFLG